MKKNIILILLTIATSCALAQKIDKSTTEYTRYGFRVYFTDKNNSPYSIEHPEAFLSQRAIDKRNRFNIALTEEDLPVNPSYVNAIQQIDTAFHICTQSKWSNTITFFSKDTSHLSAIRNLSFVQKIQSIDNYYIYDEDNNSEPAHMRDSSAIQGIDTSYYGPAYRQIAMHNGHLLHNEGYRGAGMLIAVIDGGWIGFNTAPAFQDLYNHNRIVGIYNVIPSENGIYNQSDHGTCCTSIMSSDLGYDMVGAAPDADFAFIRTEDCNVEQLFEEDFWARGAEIADSIGADIISSSLGYFEFNEPTNTPTDYSTCDGRWSIASQAATKAAHRGLIVCIAAGNEGYNAWHKISRPGDAEDILCVGAVNVYSVYAPFSSCGPSFDGRVKPDVAACGWETYVIRGSGNIESGNGTSLATPIIAGLSACLWQAIPQLSSLEIMQIIRESGHQYLNPDTLMGYGIPDYFRAWQSHHSDGVSALQRTSNYSVSPNPCHTQITVSNPNSNRISLTVFDLTGRLIQSITDKSDASISINLANEKPGVYFIKITDGNGHTETKTILKK